MANIILSTNKLTKTYKGQKAVENLSLSIAENTIYGLLGPNGAGKSTTLKMIMGIARPSSGTISFQGKPWNREALQDIGALIENPPLYGNLTAQENLLVRTTALGLPKSRIEEVLDIVDLKNTGSKKAKQFSMGMKQRLGIENLLVRTTALGLPKSRIEEVLDIVDLKNTGSKRAKQFSMGMKQRLGIALALINNPKLLILDEPTNGLDPLGIQSLRELIRSFPAIGIAVIFSSHILSEVANTVDQIGIITNGHLGYQGKLPEKSEDLEGLFMQVAKSEQVMEEW